MSEPTKLIQTRLKTDFQRGNCFPTVIACLMELSDPEDVIQFQEYYGDENESWLDKLEEWLEARNLRLATITSHLYNNEFYMVIGNTKRETSHICIYKNGELWHDPHPSKEGLISETVFYMLLPLTLVG